MRHGKKFNHLSRQKGHRRAMFANMASSLIEHKRIQTTLAKAKALRIYLEPLVTKGKNNTTHSRRVVFSYLQNKHAVQELFDNIAPKIADRPGGYLRIIRIGARFGDNAEMALIEFVDYNDTYVVEKKAKSGGKKKRSRRGGKKKSSKQTEETPVADAADAVTEAAAAVPEAAEAVAEEVVEQVEEAAETVADVAEETVETVAEVAEEAEAVVEEQVTEVVAEAEEVVEEVADTAKDVVADATEEAEPDSEEEEKDKEEDTTT